MDPSEFHAPGAGKVVSSPEGYAAFVPAPLPPRISYTKGPGARAVARRRRARRALRRRRRAAGPPAARRLVQAPGGALLVAHRGRAGEPLGPVPRPGRRRAPQRAARPPARGARLHPDAALRRGAAAPGASLAGVHQGAARAAAARRRERRAHAGRVPRLAELAGAARRHAGHRDLRAAAGRGAARAAGRVRGVPAGARQAARPHPVRHAARAVREHPPVRRRQRPAGPAAHHAVPHRAAAPHPAAALPLGLSRGAPRRVLRAAAAGAHARRVDALADVLL